jgi:hypothetical protein
MRVFLTKYWLVIVLVAAAARVIALIGFFVPTSYYLTVPGQLTLFAVFAASAFFGFSISDTYQPSHQRAQLVALVASIPFLFSGWYVVAPTFALLVHASRVVGRRQSQRLHQVVALALTGTGLLLLLVSGAFAALATWWGGVTTWPDQVSPGGMFAAQAVLINPGAMGSESVIVRVVPRFLPLVGKEIYNGDGYWTGSDEPDVGWTGPTTLRIGPRQMSVLDPPWVDS